MTNQNNNVEETWQSEFLNEGTKKGLGDLSMMIGIVGNIMHRHGEKCREEGDKKLAEWIDDNVGCSSKALFLYFTMGERPRPFDAPSDSGDRKRCVVLLQARPEWIERLSEIEELNIEGIINGIKAMPWNEQVPLIRQVLTPPTNEGKK